MICQWSNTYVKPTISLEETEMRRDEDITICGNACPDVACRSSALNPKDSETGR